VGGERDSADALDHHGTAPFLRTGLCHIPSRSPACRNGNWTMASRD
jgi:hypothetical protein